MPFVIALVVLILLLYLRYGKKIVHLAGRKLLSIAGLVLLLVFLVKSGLMGGLGRMLSFLILRIEEWFASL